MRQVDCSKCEHYRSQDCDLGFRWASGAAGQAVDDIHDVWRCRDYSSVADHDEEED
jgi:hypothetical protein